MDERTPAASTPGSTRPVPSADPQAQPAAQLQPQPAAELRPQLAAQPRNEIVHAAGGVVVRAGGAHGGDPVEVALVHRPHRADWTFPKGKLERGETFEECALREVREETGLECRLLAFAGHTEYQDRKDRLKVVAYWTMEATGGEVRPNWEVDEVRWCTPEAATGVLTYERDRELLATLVPLTAASSEA